MMTSSFVIDVTETNFEYEVIAFSQNTPVVVDFWATWCRPCKVLSPLLEKLAHEAKGAFRLARLDVDQNPNLALRYGVRNVPTVKAFTQGQVVSEFAGLLPEAQVREFLRNITPPSPLDLLIEKADGLLFLHQWEQAERAYREALQQNPENPVSLFGLAKTLLSQGEAREALAILRRFPPSRLFTRAEQLVDLAQSFIDLDQDKLPNETPLDTAFSNSIRLAKRGNLPAAMDGLLDILRQDRRYRGGKAHRVCLGILELMGEEDPQTRTYRSELGSVLF